MGYKLDIRTGKQPILLKVDVYSPKETEARLTVYDTEHKNTLYIDRDMTIKGDDTFFLRMPISPVIARVFSTVQIKKITREELPRKFTAFDWNNYTVRSFVNFIQEFCEKMGYLKTQYKYYSDDRFFEVQYLDILKTDGKKVTTPARINKFTGVIQVSAERMKPMTVPMRMAILLHEYAHFYKNKDAESEQESDMNSLFIYLGLGYPRYEAYVAWINTFDYSTPENEEPYPAHEERLRKIKDIIDNFDEKFKEISFIK